MQALHSAHKLAVLASRSGSCVGGSVASELKEQCLLRLAQTFGCSTLDGILDTGVAVRGFAAKAGPSDPSHKHNVNTIAKERHNKQTKKAKQGLKAGSAPETAAAAPAEEQPQNPEAAQHQGEILQKLQAKVDSGSSGTRAVSKDEGKKRNQGPKERARIQRMKAKEAAATAVRPAETSTSAASPPGTASPGPASSPGPATTTASNTAARQPAKESPPPDADQPQSAEPLPWRLQQKQWLAAQPKQLETASSSGIDLPQNADAQAQAINRVRPGFQPQFQGRRVGLGRYSPVAPNTTPTPPAAPQPAALTPQQIKEQDEEMKSFVRSRLYSAKTAAKDLTQEDVSLYYRLNAQAVPEAFPDFYQGTLAEGGGCKALQEEASYTGTSLIQYRESIRLLHLKAESRSQTHIYLDGPAGCGKSIALVSLVDWARSQGWLVLYVPSAQTLIEGGLFHKGEDGLWETPEVAEALLQSMVTNHARDLEKLTSSSGESLLKVAEDGLSASKPGVITAAAVSLVSEMSNVNQMPVMIAVDDYNVLYSHANYHEWMNEVHRRQLQPHELRLVSALRILEQEAPKNGMFVGAACHGGQVSPKLQVPYPKGGRHTIPKLNLEEATQQLCHYTAQGLVSNTPMYAMQAAYYATDGNAKELRRWRRRLMDIPPSTVTTSMADEHIRWFKTLPDDEEKERDVLPQQDLAVLPQELKYAEQNDGL
ncbi:hypothetical protein WJX77_012040 [Trebouxia sp. C0004]